MVPKTKQSVTLESDLSYKLVSWCFEPSPPQRVVSGLYLSYKAEKQQHATTLFTASSDLRGDVEDEAILSCVCQSHGPHSAGVPHIHFLARHGPEVCAGGGDVRDVSQQLLRVGADDVDAREHGGHVPQVNGAISGHVAGQPGPGTCLLGGRADHEEAGAQTNTATEGLEIY